jgi:nucleotide-binding universal stress UspA family protein
MFNRILVPLDGSVLAERVLPHAVQFARIFDSELILLHVLAPKPSVEGSMAVDPLQWQIHKAEIDKYLQGIAERLRESLAARKPKAGDKKEERSRVHYAIREGYAAENIVSFAHAEHVDLVVIGTHGSGGFSQWKISSITQKVINLVYLPILIIRTSELPVEQDGNVVYRRIFLPIDSSLRAESALAAGVTLASEGVPTEASSEAGAPQVHSPPSKSPPQKKRLLLGAVLKLPELPIPEPYPQEIELFFKQLMNVSRQAVNAYLDGIKDRFPLECDTLLVESNNISSAIQEIANTEENIDLVVMCAHGYTGDAATPYGSIARNYIEHGIKHLLIIQDMASPRAKSTLSEIASRKPGGR